jgi:hypothetical protein
MPHSKLQTAHSGSTTACGFGVGSYRFGVAGERAADDGHLRLLHGRCASDVKAYRVASATGGPILPHEAIASSSRQRVGVNTDTIGARKEETAAMPREC